AGFYIQNSGGADGTFCISNNNANGNARYGFEVVGSTGIRFDGGGGRGNANSNTLGGFLIDSSSNITVTMYNANSNGGNGIYVRNSTAITIDDNIARSNALNGYLFENSSGLTITANIAGGTPNQGNNNNGFSFVN